MIEINVEESVFKLLDPLGDKERLRIIETLLEKYVDSLNPETSKKSEHHHEHHGNCCDGSKVEEQESDLDLPPMTLKKGMEDVWIDHVAKQIKIFQKDRIDALAPNEEIVIPDFSPAVEFLS